MDSRIVQGPPYAGWQKGKTMNTINTLNDLHDFFNTLPDGTEADILSSDLEAGNFETAHLTLPDGSEREVHYAGPVAEGYVSPFDWQRTEEDMDA